MKNFERKLNDLAGQRADKLQAAEDALEAGNKTVYDAAMADVSNLDTQIKDVKTLMDAQNATPAAPAIPTTPAADNDADATERLRASNEYVRAFCRAVRMRATPTTAGGVDALRPLMNALTEGTNEDGGFLVPVDLQTRINELRRQLVDLSTLVTVEPVNTNTGYRVIDTHPTAGFTKTAEMGEIPKNDQPAFSRIGYTCADYGLIVPISNDLLEDNDAGLMEYLARWMAKKAVITENKIILALLATLVPAAVAAAGELAAIKKALNKGLDPDIALNAALLTNQSGYNCLDQLEDKNGRPLLQPDITAGSGYTLKQKHITMVSDSVLANAAAGSLMYIGDFKQFITVFLRKTMEFTATNVGGDSWRTNSTEGRAIMRLDAQKLDGSAAVALALAGGLDAAG